MGLKPGEVVGQSVFDVYRDRPDILENMRRSLAGETFTVPVTAGNHVYDAHHTPLPNEQGEYVGTIGVLVVVIRVANPNHPDGVMFAILLGNIFAPLIDTIVVRANIARRERRSA